jgi:hypothetical protein
VHHVTSRLLKVIVQQHRLEQILEASVLEFDHQYEPHNRDYSPSFVKYQFVKIFLKLTHVFRRPACFESFSRK